jgi:serine/threonine protein kinase
MFTDIVGYSARASRDELETFHLVQEHNRILSEVITVHKGEIVKTIGDAVMGRFQSVVRAVECALEIQKALGEFNADKDEAGRLNIRIGVHAGDVLQTADSDLFGHDVNIAARLEPLAEPGSVIITDTVYTLVKGKSNFSFHMVGDFQLKNIPAPIRLYSVSHLDEPIISTPAEQAGSDSGQSQPLVSHYQLIEKIGAGGMGEVWLAEDTYLERKVALKFLPYHVAQEETEKARFIQEAKAAARLSHSNIAQIYEIGEEEGRLFIVMEYVGGGSLRDKLARAGGRTLPIEDVLSWVQQTADGLSEAHKQGVVHRDIKPDNIMLTESGQIKITDFGLARIETTTRLTVSGATLGTVNYMSPEQVVGKNVDHRADLFSLGATFYELLTGHRAFEGDDASSMYFAILNSEVDSLHRYCKSLPAGIDAVVEKLLEKDPAYRYQSAEEVRADILRFSRKSGTAREAGVRKSSPIRRIRSVIKAVSTPRLLYALGIIGLLALVVWQVLPGQPATTHSGTLGPGSSESITGEYFDTYTFKASAGQRVSVNMISSDFDTYLSVQSPSGEKTDNNDYQGSTSRSLVEMDIPESGTWEVFATSNEAREAGSYLVTITLSSAVGAASGRSRIESGTLAQGDEELPTGEFYDSYTMKGSRGEKTVIDLHTTEFDPYLIVRAPSSEQFENDDHEGDESRSLLSLDLTEDGTYTVLVTSFEVGETGNYDLEIWSGSADKAVSGPRVESGDLSAGDETLRSGEYADAFTFEGTPGQHARLDLSSPDFDTYLMLRGPGEINMENDDVEGDPGHSIIDLDLTERGTYRVIVTSVENGETGQYRLAIDISDAVTAGSRQRDVHTIDMDGSVSGRLEAGDSLYESGEYRDLYVFNGSEGQNIVLEMTSPDFDTYLALIYPSGEVVENDDFGDDIEKSRLELTLPESGRYQVVATSYEGGLSGEYRVTLESGVATAPATDPAPLAETGRVYGMFVGISDYPGDLQDLPFTSDDARRVHQALVQGAGMESSDGVVLVDGDATVENVRDAFQRMGERVNQDDLFVFFYSGHGDRQERSSPQPSDPDNLDEMILLYDGSITDDEMSDLCGLISSRVSLIIIDASYSGGFSKDVISVSGRMGLFSSQEDVVSSVAVKFKAGGFLAPFLADAIGERLADVDRDNQLTATELSQYLDDRYRTYVRAGGADENIRTAGPELGYQQFVFDRGDLGPSVIVLRLTPEEPN